MARKLAKQKSSAKILKPLELRSMMLDAVSADDFSNERLREYIVVLAEMHGMLCMNHALSPDIPVSDHEWLEAHSKAAWRHGGECAKEIINDMVQAGELKPYNAPPAQGDGLPALELRGLILNIKAWADGITANAIEARARISALIERAAVLDKHLQVAITT